MRRASVLAILLLFACSKPEPAAPAAEPKAAAPTPPSVAEARELIGGSAELGEFEFTNAGCSIPVAKENRGEAVNEDAKGLAGAGWIRIGGTGTIELTDKGSSDKRFILRPNGILDVVPLAKKEMGEVSAVRPNPDGTADADFTWRWVPNEVGSALGSGPVAQRFEGVQKSTATLIWDGTSWSVLKIARGA